IDVLRGAHIEALNADDPDGWVDLFTPDGIQMPPGYPANVGRESIRGWTRAFMEPFRVEFALSADEVQIVGDWAFARGRYRVALHPKAGGHTVRDEGKYITLYERQSDGQWGIARDIWNSNVQG